MRALAWFWSVVLVLLAAGAATLQVLGPPSHAKPALAAKATAPASAKPEPAAPASPAPGIASAEPPKPLAGATSAPAMAAAPPAAPGRVTAGPIAAPDPALIEPVEGAPQGLPRVAADGRKPMQVYARGFDPSDRRPRIGLLLAGVGLNEADSDEAIRTLPGEVSLAVSPYAAKPQALLATARTFGHEYLISIPMEPQGYPLNDAGNEALLTANTADENRNRLLWNLTRIAGYVGATAALDGMRGERFSASGDQFAPVQELLATRGLLYVDPRPSTGDMLPEVPMPTWNRRVDVVVDEPPLRAEIEAKLASLEQIAHDKGSAVGLAGVIRHSTLDAILAWSNGLSGRGFALAPVSKLMSAPTSEQASR